MITRHIILEDVFHQDHEIFKSDNYNNLQLKGMKV